MEIKKTISSIFLTPTLKIPRDALYNNGYINAYIKDINREEQYDNCVYLLFKPVNINRFREFIENEYERTTVVDDYDYEDGYVVVVYHLNMLFSTDFELIKKGKYSKTSPEFQKLFPRIVKLTVNGLHRDELSLQYRVFNKTPDLIQFQEDRFGMQFDKSQEIWEGFLEENEILNIEKIKQYVE